MAGAILASVVTTVLKRLSTFTPKASSSSSTEPVEQELQKLESTMRRIHAVLADAEEKDVSDKSEQLHLRELKEVAYDAEDAVDEYEYEVLYAKVEARRRARATHMTENKQVTFDLNSYHPKVPISGQLANRVKDIRRRFEEITDDWNRISLREKYGQRRCIRKWKPTETASWFDEAKTFGRKDEKNKIIKWLLQEQDESSVHSFSILCIVGMGGLGKSTLAQMSYNDLRVCQHFNLRGWIYVSEDFDIVNLVKKICLSLIKNTIDESNSINLGNNKGTIDTFNSINLMSLDELYWKLRMILDGKKFFLVLDNVWNQNFELWSSLEAFLSQVGVGKILVTTRNERVAKIMQAIDCINLSQLPFNDSWLLFKKIAYEGRDHKFLEIGKKIVEKCGGLPLAIKVLASILSVEDEEGAWVDLMESELWELDKENDNIFPVLKLSYEHLPVEMKSCFMYLCLFPKGLFLDKSSIVQQWVSHGFIQPERKKKEEDVGNDYWNEFLYRSILQYHSDTHFLMHDLIHDLAQSVAKDEYLLMTTLKSHDMVIPKTIRHVSLHIEDKFDITDLEFLHEASQLRTLILSVRGKISIMDLLPNLRCLRILVLWGIENSSDSFGSMKHLRYLDIGHTNAIPASVYNLFHLRTLKIFDSKIRLSRNIEDLINLRHLQGKRNSSYHLPRVVVGLTNLQTLPCISRGDASGDNESLTLRDLKELPNLRGSMEIRELGTVAWADVTPPEAYLKYKSGIKNLTLHWGGIMNVDEKLAAQMLDFLQRTGELATSENWRPQRTGDLRELETVNYPDEDEELTLHWEGTTNADVELTAQMLDSLQSHGDLRELETVNYPDEDEELTLHWEGTTNADEELVAQMLDFLEPHRYLRELETVNYTDEDEELTLLLKGSTNVDEKLAAQVLDCLQPHRDLRKLSIFSYPGVILPTWLGNELPALQELGIGAPRVKNFVVAVEKKGGQFSSLSPPIAAAAASGSTGDVENRRCFPSLESLGLLGMDELEEWQVTDDRDLPCLHELLISLCPKLRKLPSLSHLSSMAIVDCPELKSLPSLPLLTDLCLSKQFSSDLLFSCSCLPLLRTLEIWLYSDETLMFPNDGSLNLIEKLSINECEALRSIKGLSGLASLHKLVIKHCPLLRISPDERLPPNLQKVKIKESPGAEEWYLSEYS